MHAIFKFIFISLIFVGQMNGDFPVPKLPFNPHQYICYKTSASLTLDGRLIESDWQKTVWTKSFVDIEGKLKPQPSLKTRVKMLWDEAYFYIGAEMEEPHIWATLTERDAVIFYDNDFEVFIDPDGDSHNYYELEVNAYGTEWDLLLLKPYRDQDRVAVDSWDIQGLITKVFIDGTLNDPSDVDNKWSVEIAIPWKVLEECASSARPTNGDQWRVNFSRVHWDTEVKDGQYRKLDTPEHNWVWSPQGLIAMHYPEMWGFVQFSEITVGDKTADFHWQEDEDAKWVLRELYYQQKKMKNISGFYTDDISQLHLDSSPLQNFSWPPNIILTSAGYEASLSHKITKTILLIREDGKTWKVTN